MESQLSHPAPLDPVIERLELSHIQRDAAAEWCGVHGLQIELAVFDL